MNKKIFVDRQRPISLSEIFEKECGKFIPTSPFNETSSQINSFTFNDLELIECPREKISGTNFAFFLSNTLGLTPLDGFHARTIFENKESLATLNELLKPFWWRKGFNLKTITFFGDTARNEDLTRNFFCFSYEKKYENPIFVTFDNDPAWSYGSDLALVFKNSFIKKTFPPKKEDNFKKKKKS